MMRRKTVLFRCRKHHPVSRYLVAASLTTALLLPSPFLQPAFGGQQEQENMRRDQSGMDSQESSEQHAIKPGNRALIDREIRSRDGDVIGEIANVVVDSTGQVQYVIAEIEGFWGLGSEESMVPIEKLSLTQHRSYVYFKGTPEELEMYPDYSDYGWAGRRYGSAADDWFNAEEERYENSAMNITGWAEKRAGTRVEQTGQYTTTEYGGTDINQDIQAYSPSDGQKGEDNDQRANMRGQQQAERQDRSHRGYNDLSYLRSSSNPMMRIDWQEFGPHGIQASRLLHKEVRNRSDENLGSVSDVVITPAGDIRLVLFVGDALNINGKKVQADLQDIEMVDGVDYIIYDVSKQELKNDPEYTPEKRTASLSKNAAAKQGAKNNAKQAQNSQKQQ